jgi:hypothetical protein
MSVAYSLVSLKYLLVVHLNSCQLKLPASRVIQDIPGGVADWGGRWSFLFGVPGTAGAGIEPPILPPTTGADRSGVTAIGLDVTGITGPSSKPVHWQQPLLQKISLNEICSPFGLTIPERLSRCCQFGQTKQPVGW